MIIIFFFILSFTLFDSTLCMERKKYSYLQSTPFKERWLIAADWASDCDIIIEIGGAGAPIDMHIKDKPVIVIDPGIKRKEDELVTHIPQCFEQWHEPEILKEKSFAVIMLGLTMKMNDDGWHKLFNLINRSKKTIIEYSATFKKAKKQAKYILGNSNLTIIDEKELDLSHYDYKNYPNVYPFRKMICLQQK